MFWSPERKNRIAVALLLGLIIAGVASYISDSDESSFFHRGDFPGFYVQGEIINRGLEADLYSPEVQRSIENELWPSFKGNFYMSAYPPYVAALLWPLVFLGPSVSQLVFTAFMILCALYSVYILSKLNRSLKENLFFASVIMFLFMPLFCGVLGAQNTGLSMALLSSAVFLSEKNTKRSDFFVGISLGLWLFKPQYALFAIILYSLVGKRPWSLAGAAIPAALYYILGSLIRGPFWPLEWIEVTRIFGNQNFISNSREMVSALGGLKALGFYFGGNSSLFSIFGSLFALWVFYRTVTSFLSNKGNLAQLGMSLPLISPQTLFYDLGLAVVTYLAILDFNSPSTPRKICAVCLVSIALFALRDLVNLPLFFPLAILFWVTSGMKKMTP